MKLQAVEAVGKHLPNYVCSFVYLSNNMSYLSNYQSYLSYDESYLSNYLTYLSNRQSYLSIPLNLVKLCYTVVT